VLGSKEPFVPYIIEAFYLSHPPGFSKGNKHRFNIKGEAKFYDLAEPSGAFFRA